jgi:hypothetical protein
VVAGREGGCAVAALGAAEPGGHAQEGCAGGAEGHRHGGGGGESGARGVAGRGVDCEVGLQGRPVHSAVGHDLRRARELAQRPVSPRLRRARERVMAAAAATALLLLPSHLLLRPFNNAVLCLSRITLNGN